MKNLVSVSLHRYLLWKYVLAKFRLFCAGVDPGTRYMAPITEAVKAGRA